MLIKVDLPAPFSPTMPVIAPLAMLSDTPRTACTLPNDFWMPESSIAGAAITASTKTIFRHSRYFRQRAWCCRFRQAPTGCRPPRHPERSRPKGGVVEGPVFADASTKQVPPLRLASLGSGRDDGSLGK